MKKYKVLDIFSYVSQNIIDLEQLENIFNDCINDGKCAINNYHMEKYEHSCRLDENINMAVSELENEGKSIAFIKDCDRVIAVIGYREI